MLVGVLVWALLVWLSIRYHRQVKSSSKSGSGASVSRNRTGPSWEQDEPYPECFEEDDL